MDALAARGFASLALACAVFVPREAPGQTLAPDAREAGRFEQAAAAPRGSDEHRIRAQLGGALVQGNARSFTLNVAARYQLRRGPDALTVEGASNLGYAGGATGYERSAENHLVRARYDRYFGLNSLWVSPLFFRDPFAGFDARASGQVGYLRNLLEQPGRRRLKAELGVDATYEWLRFTGMVPARCAAGTAPSPAGSGSCGAFAFLGRVFIGYEDEADARVSFNVGVEALANALGLSPPEGVAPDVRVNAAAGLALKVRDFFSMGVQYTLRAMAQPIGSAGPIDQTALLTLNLSHAFDAPGPAPSACPPCPAVAARAGAATGAR
jgi:hypothetical protein